MPWWNMQFQYRGFDPSKFILFPLMVPLALWSLFWKGLALWRAAQNKQKGWFIALLVINTAGILEIVYLLFFSTPRSIKAAGKKS